MLKNNHKATYYWFMNFMRDEMNNCRQAKYSIQHNLIDDTKNV